jgi:imidazolonepropionase-like amidohydrolase
VAISAETVAAQTLRCVGEALRALQAGVTSIRCAGDGNFVDGAVKAFFERGAVIGPRVVPCGYYMTTTAGHGVPEDEAILALDGPEAWRNAIRRNIRHGAEHIKVNMSGGIWGPAWDDIEAIFQSDDELEAIFGTCRQRNMPVMAHAAGAKSARRAAELGAKSIEHGYTLDEAAVEAMAANGTMFVPTLAMSQLSAGLAEDRYETGFLAGYYLPPAIKAKALNVAERARWGFEAARKAGITIAAGSDTNPIAEGARFEVVLMVRCGMTPREALLAATHAAADLAGYGDVTGSIAEGREADLVALGSDPLADIYAIRDIRGVWRAGARVQRT